MDLADLFPDEAAAKAWFELLIWRDGRHCPRCGSADTHEATATSGLPCCCSGSHKPFSARIGTAHERSRLPFRTQAFAIYLEMTNLKGVSSMKLHRDPGVTQKTARFMLHRIREAFPNGAPGAMDGPVKADEPWIGGKQVRTVGLARARIKIQMMNFVYNLRRLAWLQLHRPSVRRYALNRPSNAESPRHRPPSSIESHFP